MTIEKLGSFFGKGSPTSQNFPGVYLHEMVPVLRNLGATVQEIDTAGASLQTIETAAAQGRGPVVFGVQWWKGASGIVGPMRNAGVEWSTGDHMLAAFRNLRGEIMVADQFGVRPIAQLGTIGGNTTPFTMASRFIVYENVAFARAAEALQTAGKTMTGGTSAAARSWLAASLGIEMVVVNETVAQKLDSAVRQALGRPPRDIADWSNSAGSEGGSGPGSYGSSGPPQQTVVLSPAAQALLSAIGAPGATRDWKDARQKSGLAPAAANDAVQELEAKGMIKVERWGADPLNIKSLTRVGGSPASPTPRRRETKEPTSVIPTYPNENN